MLDIRHQSLNELLNKLEKRGYFTREPSGEDRRAMVIRLTEKGKQEPYVDMDFDGLFSCLNEEEQQTFGEYLDRVIAALEDRLGDEPDAPGDQGLFDDFRRGPRPPHPPGPRFDPRGFPPAPPRDPDDDEA